MAQVSAGLTPKLLETGCLCCGDVATLALAAHFIASFMAIGSSLFTLLSRKPRRLLTKNSSWPVNGPRSCNMANLTYKPVVHEHKSFIAHASKRKGFAEAYEALALEYQLAPHIVKERPRARPTQNENGTTPGRERKG